jgi:hypothetical protein
MIFGRYRPEKAIIASLTAKLTHLNTYAHHVTSGRRGVVIAPTCSINIITQAIGFVE